jgi:hypothetical protein
MVRKRSGFLLQTLDATQLLAQDVIAPVRKHLRTTTKVDLESGSTCQGQPDGDGDPNFDAQEDGPQAGCQPQQKVPEVCFIQVDGFLVVE